MPDTRTYKIVIIGQEKAGKTALMNQEVRNQFFEQYCPTIGTDFMIKTYNAGTTDEKKIRLWDLAGQERFDSLSPIYFKHSDAAIICVAPTELIDKAYINNKITDLRQINPAIHITLVSTKADLKDSQQTAEQLKLFADLNHCDFASVSAKHNAAVTELFQKITDTLTPIILSHSLPSLIKRINTLSDETTDKKAFRQALTQLTNELAKKQKQSKNLDATDKIIRATHDLLTALAQHRSDDTKAIFQTYQNDCPRQSTSLLSKLIKIVVITGLCAAVGAAVTAGVLGLSLGLVLGVSASVAAAGLLSSSIGFFKKDSMQKAVENVITTANKMRPEEEYTLINH